MSLVYDDAEFERRHEAVRRAAQEAGVDAVVACASEYTGFEGAVFWLSGFRVLHRYVYTVVPADGSPATNLYPREARWVGTHEECWVDEQVFADLPGQWIAERAAERGWRRLGTYGSDYIIPVRDLRALEAGPAELVRFDERFDLARAVKSPVELESARESMRINEAGWWAVLEAWEPGIGEHELMAVAERFFVSQGTGRLTMDMVMIGPDGAALPEMRHPEPGRRVRPGDLLVYGLEIAAHGGHWVEFSRPMCDGEVTPETQRMMEAYEESHALTREALRAGATAHDVHRAVSEPFRRQGWKLGHVTGHSIGTTMIEHPRIGEGVDVELREDMVCSMHPHVISQDERTCMYFQDTFHVGADGAQALSSGVPVRVFRGAEQPVE